MEPLIPILFVVFIVGLAVLSIICHSSRSNSLLEQWAQRNGFRIIRQEYRTFFRGPFFLTTSKGQTVYHVTVEDRHGKRRHGWVRCGGYFLGLFSGHVDVRWED